MSQRLLALYVTATTRVRGSVASDKGQGTLEYVGIVVVAALLVAAVVAAIGNGDTIRTAIQTKISEITSAG